VFYQAGEIEAYGTGFSKIKIVFCKTFLEEIAKHFWRLLQLHFGGSCSGIHRGRGWWAGHPQEVPRL